jgi:hypothetical protein
MNAVANPRDVPAAHAIIRRLCALQAHVCSEVLGYDHPADCFCGDEGFWPLEDPDDYRNDAVAVEFIENAVLVAIRKHRADSPGATE